MKNKKYFTFRIFPDGFLEKRVLFADKNVEKDAVAAELPEKDEDSLGIANTEAELIKVKSNVDQQKLAEEIQKEKEKTLKSINLDKLAISVLRKNSKINADKWDPSTEAGLAEIKKDWEKLGFYQKNEFYENIFAVLGRSSNKTFLSKITDKNEKLAYLNPSEAADLSFDPAYKMSFDFFTSVQKILVDQDKAQMGTGKSLQEKDQDPIFTEATNIVRENVETFKEAIKNKDYATAAVYVVGLYAMWKTYDKMDKTKKDKYGKYLYWGAALYAGNIFAKNAGYDVLKKLGLKEQDAELKGTPLRAIYHPNLDIKEMKDVDPGIVQDVALTRIADLYGEYQKSNDAEIQFIDPNSFPNSFASEKFYGLSPNVISKTTPLSNKEKKYRDVGRQLYLFVKSMEIAYEKTMRPEYKMSFEQLLSDPIKKNITVLDFMTLLSDYVGNYDKEFSISGAAGSEKAKNRLNDVFDSSYAFGLEGAEINPGTGEYAGSIMGYPVVVRTNSTEKQYLIFSKSEYEKSGGVINENKKLAAIPFEGDASGALDGIKTSIKGNVIKLYDNLKNGYKYKLSGIIYDPTSASWTTNVTVPGFAKLGYSDKDEKFELEISADGSTMEVLGVGEHPALSIAVKNLVNQPGFESLKVLYNEGLLHMEEADPNNSNDYGFNLYVGMKGKKNLKLELEYYSVKGEFNIKKGVLPKVLLQDPEFAQIYVEAISKTPDFTKTFDRLHKLIDLAPEEFHITFVEELSKWVTDATLQVPWAGGSTSLLSGSVKDNYTNAIIDYKKDFILKSLENNITSSTSFADLDSNVAKSFKVPLIKLDSIADNITQEQTKLGTAKWTSENFMSLVIEPIKNSNLSAQYLTISNDLEKGIISSLKLGKSDVVKEPHLTLNKIRSVFSYYTAHLDEPGLDKLTYPYIFGDQDPYNKVAYIADVKEKIINKVATFDDNYKENIPYAGSGEWGIKTFESWKDTAPSVAPYNPLDKEPALTDEKLSDKLKEEIDKMVGLLKLSESNLKSSVLDSFIKKEKIKSTYNAKKINEYSNKFSDQTIAVEQYVYDLKVEIYLTSKYWQDYSVWKKLVHKVSSI